MLTAASSATIGIALIAALATDPRMVQHQRSGSVADVELLAALVGEWQTDTVSGMSARSSCVWTPRHGGLVCEQRIDSPTGASTSLNLFTEAPATGNFVLYVLSRPGDAVSPVPLSIHGRVWIYGGGTPAGDGRYYRTINDFSRTDAYTWRQEMSVDGKEWTPGIHGESRRVR